MARTRTVLVAYGTRPEAIKMAPLIARLRDLPAVRVVVVVTGQHREMLDQVNSLFGIRPDYDLDIITPRQSLADITSRVLVGLTTLLVQGERPDALLVQGDTTTSFAGALSGFYQKIPVVHLEAGFRTGLRYNPFPEEMNRRLTAQLTDLHLAPSPAARSNLEAEGVCGDDVVVTGNTCIDALLWAVSKRTPFTDSRIPDLLAATERTVLVTTHRRESWGEPMARVAQTISGLARQHRRLGFVLPAHLNPEVRDVLLPRLMGLENVLVVDPLPYGEFCHLMSECDLVVTDSGGVQEEAPSLGKPVLLLRETTERPEGVAAGAARLVGTDPERLTHALQDWLDSPGTYRGFDQLRNPYGDGRAAIRGCAAITELLGVGSRVADFEVTKDVNC